LRANLYSVVKTEELRQLRQRLGCTARDLAYTLALEPEVIHAWEDGEAFPTKRHVGQLQTLAQAGPSAIRKRPKKGFCPVSPGTAGLLTEPAFLQLVERFLADPELYQRVIEMAGIPTPPTDPNDPVT
jgi:hypothetical protein